MNKAFLIVILLLLSGHAWSQGVPGTVRFPSNLDTADSLVNATNNCSTTLNGAITSGSTTITVVSTSCFPATGVITIESELIIYESKTSTTFTSLTRGAFSTVAASHASGLAVRLNILAQHLTTRGSAIIATQTKIGTGSFTPTANQLLRGTGTGTSDWGQLTTAHVALGSLSGNGTKLGTTAGTQTNGKCLEWDANGNIVTAVSGAECGIGVTITVANEGVTGTLSNGLVKLTGAPSTAIRTATSDTAGAVGVVTAGAGTTGSATIQITGSVSCVFENATTAGNYVIFGSATAGNCRDGGATYPTSGQVVGRVLSTNGSAGTYAILLFGPEIKPTSGGGGGAWSAITDPTGDLALSMGSNKSTFTFNNSTGANNLFNFTDSTTNSSATGHLIDVTTTAGSTLRPFRITAAGTAALFVNHLAQSLFGSTTVLDTNSKVEISGNPTDAFGNSLLRLNASGSNGTGITFQNTSHTWSLINRNNGGANFGLFYHGQNYALNVSYTDRAVLESTGNHSFGIKYHLNPTASGGRVYSINSTANSHSLGGGYFAILDETASETPRFIIDSTGLAQQRSNTATTNATVATLTVRNDTTGTPANGLGTKIAFEGESSTTAGRPLGELGLTYQNVTDASRTTYATIGTVANAAAINARFITGPETTLTDATATDVFTVALPTLTAASGVLEFTAVAGDGTDIQARSAIVRWSTVNKSGTYANETAVVSEAVSASAGTLTCTYAWNNGTNQTTLRATCDTSLTPTSFYGTWTLKNNSRQAITVN